MKIKVPEKEDEEKEEQKAKIQMNPMVTGPILNSRSISLVKDALTSPLPSQMPRTLKIAHLFIYQLGIHIW